MIEELLPLDAHLPVALSQLNPHLKQLTAEGDASLLRNGIRVAIVGSRRASNESHSMAHNLASELASIGITVVSGLAIGIDTTAHKAALEAGGATIAVIGSGLRSVYPKSNQRLAEKVSAGRGVIVSEYGDTDRGAFKHHFPRRNQIIAALSHYVIIVQAHERSGSMSTANAALSLGIPVGVAPIDPRDLAFAGALQLIREGADTVFDAMSVVRRLAVHSVVDPSVIEIFDEGGYFDHDMKWHPRMMSRSEQHETLREMAHPFAMLLEQPRTEDELAHLTGLSLRETRRNLVELEREQRATLSPDGRWVRIISTAKI